MDEEDKIAQEEEVEVLKSIYEGDEAFSALPDNVFQYKVGQDGTSQSFILQVTFCPPF